MAFRPRVPALQPRHGEALAGAGLVLLAAYVIREASRMPAGTIALPGPGFFPMGLAVLLAVTGAGLALRALLRPGAGGQPVRLGHRHIAVTLLALAGVALLLERLGFLLTAGLFLLLLFRTLSGSGWLRAALAAAATTAAAYLFFHTALGVPLPGGGAW